MREVHGVADAKLNNVGGRDDTSVIVTDRDGAIEISVGRQAWSAILTVEQAEFFAGCLTASAARVRELERCK